MQNKRREVLTIGSLNIHGVRGKRAEIVHAIQELELDVLALSETWTKTPPNIQGFKLLTVDPMVTENNQLRRGQALYYRECLQARKVDLPLQDETFSSCRFLAIEIRNQNKDQPLTFLTGYNPPGSRLNANYLDQVVEDFDWVVLGGDLNARHRDFGDTRTNRTGSDLKRFVTSSGMSLLNNKDFTFFGPMGSSIPDVFLTELAFRDQVTEFGTSDSIESDHRMIFIRVDWPHAIETSRVIQDFRNADWELFEAVVSTGIEPEPLDSREAIDSGIDNLTKSLSDAAEMAIEKKTVPVLRDYLSDKAKRLIRLRNKYRRKWKKYRANEYHVAMNALARKISRQRSRDYDRFLRTHGRKIVHGPGGPDFWKSMRFLSSNLKGRRLASFFTDQGIFVNDPAEVANAYAEYMAGICSEPVERVDAPLTDAVIQDFVDENPEMFDVNFEDFFVEAAEDENVLALVRPISVLSLETAIRSLPNKAPGKDGITARLIKRMGRTAFDRLRDIMNECLKIGYFPKAWKEAVLVIIHKPGKDPKEIGSYRPISLLSVFGKLFEKVLHWRMSDHLEQTGFFSESQIGFRRNRETTEALFELSQDIMLGLDRQSTATGFVLFDAEKAFDKTWTKGLLLKAHQMNIFPTRLLRLLASYFTDRKIQVRVGNRVSRQLSITAGTPQGSILSPLLYLISTNDLSQEIFHSDRVKTTQFADDLKLSTARRRKVLIQPDLQRSVDKLGTYSKTWRMTFNARKTKYLVVHRGRQHNSALTMNGERIEETRNAKYLGVTFNNRGSAKDHVDDIARRAGQRLGFLNTLKKAKVIPPEFVLFAYKVYIRPIIEYAYPAWCGGLTKADMMKLERIQRRAIKIAYGWPQWTPTEHIYHRTPIEPLPDRLQAVGRAFLQRKPNVRAINRVHRLDSVRFPGRVLNLARPFW